MMNILKKIGLVIAIIFALILIAGLFLSGDLKVEAEREFNAPKEYLFNLMNDMKDVPLWNNWVIDDPEIELHFSPVTMGKGAFYTWASEKSGEGQLSFRNVYKSDSIVATLQFGDMDESLVKYEFANESSKTKVKMTMKSHMGFPYNLMKWFFKRSVFNSYEKSFDHMEKVIEERKNGKYYGFQIKESDEPEKYYLSNRDIVASDEVNNFYAQNMTSIFKKIQDEGVMMNGKPSALFYERNNSNQESDVAAAVPLNAEFSMEGLVSITLPRSNAVTIDYFGDKSGIEKAHRAAKAYMRDRGYFKKLPIVEEYVTDAVEIKDPSKWQTRLLYYFDVKN